MERGRGGRNGEGERARGRKGEREGKERLGRRMDKRSWEGIKEGKGSMERGRERRK